MFSGRIGGSIFRDSSWILKISVMFVNMVSVLFWISSVMFKNIDM
ncbi:8878_t:CDS:2 [Funneliformis geosporum]|uniref:8878_t:CDS:1 n=1 Tax=Funneliformis geosporum TaxID=1117311 RepID=A0A9W4WPG0_9GLOM|nr:8878_t:CDS:2 [Funneliformis geosporum]